MGTGEKIEVTLSGGAPWGFRLMGGESAPLVVSKIRKKSKAHTNGIKEGDAIITINGQSTSGRTHDESMALVDASSGSLVLEVYRGDVKDLATVSSLAAVVNGTSEPHKPDNVTSSATSETIIDGNKTTKVETQSWVHKGSDSSTTAFVHKRQTMTKDASSSSYFPLPSPLDAKYMVQPFSSKPVQVQVSAMFSDHSDDMKENVSPNVSSSPKKAVPTFNVRKFTTAKEEKWQPSDMFAAKQKKNLKEKEQYIQQQQGMWQQHQQQQQMHQRMQQQQQQYQQQQQQQQQYQQQQQQNLQWQSQSPQQQNVQWQSQSQQMAWDDAGHWKPERLEDWKPNIWEPGQEPELSQQEKEEPRLSVLEIQKKLMAPKPVAKSFQPPLRQVYSNEEQQQELKSPHHLPVFAPRVEIALDHDSAESDISSPSSSLSTKKLYSDSAFYDDPNHNYPTIQDQMKLCKAISLSLTANVNKKARGASMFAKRQRKSSRWIHDGERSSSHGAADDIAYLSDLDSELHITEGGTKPLFTFRIPSVKHRVKSPEEDIPMALSKEQFEQLRLNTKKCEHHSVAPNQCFDLAQSLKSNKGKAGRLFEKRRARSEKYVIDETNCKRPTKTPSNKLEDMLNAQNKPMSPWNAAMKGDMSGAFDHLSEYERKQKLNQMLKYEPPKPTAAPVRVQNMPIPKITHLEADHHLEILKGHDFNRKAKGWTGFQDGSDYYESPLPQSRPVKEVPPQVAPKPGLPSSQYGNYNPKIKAWHSPEPSMSSPSEYGGRVWTPISNDSYMNGSSGTSPCAMSPMGYHASPGLYQAHMVPPDTPYQSVSRAEELPGSDL